MKHSIAFLCPYFGKINHDLHSLWLLGCEANTTIDFILITDDEDALNMDMPSNVKGHYMTWNECVSVVKKAFPFEIKLGAPYKLCDYRPAFGEIFSEYLLGYDFWGHTDSGDTLYGDLRKFITDEILDNNDKIQIYGHLTLYKNSPENNRRFKLSDSTGFPAKRVMTAEENLCFDDMFHPSSVNRIYVEHGFPMEESVPGLVADILPYDWSFRLSKNEQCHRVFEWNKGKLFEVLAEAGELQYNEIGYVHFQKRKMGNETGGTTDHFYMIPNKFISAGSPLTYETVEKWSRDRIYLDPYKARVKRFINYAKSPEAFVHKIKEKLT